MKVYNQKGKANQLNAQQKACLWAWNPQILWTKIQTMTNAYGILWVIVKSYTLTHLSSLCNPTVRSIMFVIERRTCGSNVCRCFDKGRTSLATLLPLYIMYNSVYLYTLYIYIIQAPVSSTGQRFAVALSFKSNRKSEDWERHLIRGSLNERQVCWVVKTQFSRFEWRK